MALRVLDGNQTATTLSSVITGGEHIVAHTVVSIGTQAITDISGAISGSTVCVGNLGLLQSTVATEGITASGTFIKIGGHSGTSTTGHIVHVSAVGALRVDGSVYTQPVSIASVTIGNTVTIAGTVTANLANVTGDNGDVVAKGVQIGFYDTGADEFRKVASSDPLPISGTVTVGGFSSVSVGSGAVLVAGSRDGTIWPIVIDSGTGNVAVQLKQSSGPSVDPISEINGLWVRQANNSTVTIASLPALVAGTAQIGSVTASISGTVPISISSVTIGNSVTIGAGTAQIGSVTASISSFATSVTAVQETHANLKAQAQILDSSGNQLTYASTGTAGSPSSDVISIQGISGGTAVSVSISSVTIGAVPNGALTTRFGSVTTANTAQISSAVTLATRKYLLIQNVTTSSNVITVGIGFTPTTTQGIQLAVGAGITFESSYIPTGAVYILSSVTASPFTIIEA